MRVLLAHNRYRLRGGEDTVFDQERDLLRSHGDDVVEYTVGNDDVDPSSPVALGIRTLWSTQSHAEVTRLIRETRPDVLHVHNTLPLLSPSIFAAASDAGVPVVKTLHNYRLLCANGMLVRDGSVCEDCVGRSVAWPALVHKCYRGSRGATAAVVATVAMHRAIGTYRRKVTRYIALCEFSRSKVLEAGLPPERVVVRPNFTIDRYAATPSATSRTGALWLGRLSGEKGISVLLDAWPAVPQVPLSIIGTGPMGDEVRRTLTAENVRHLGYVDDTERTRALADAAFVVMPSVVYEGFPMVIAESFSAGTPIIASRLGAMAELVVDGVTGLHFTPGDAADLAAKVRWAHEHPEDMLRMGRTARQVYEARYTAETGYRRLIEIYQEAIAAAA